MFNACAHYQNRPRTKEFVKPDIPKELTQVISFNYKQLIFIKITEEMNNKIKDFGGNAFVKLSTRRYIGQ